MALDIIDKREESTSVGFTADRRLYLNADKTRVCEEGDPEAASLLAAEGSEVSAADAELYSLTKARSAPAPEDKSRKASTKDKDAPAPEAE